MMVLLSRARRISGDGQLGDPVLQGRLELQEWNVGIGEGVGRLLDRVQEGPVEWKQHPDDGEDQRSRSGPFRPENFLRAWAYLSNS